MAVTNKVWCVYDPTLPFPQDAQFGRGRKTTDGVVLVDFPLEVFYVDDDVLLRGKKAEKYYEVPAPGILALKSSGEIIQEDARRAKEQVKQQANRDRDNALAQTVMYNGNEYDADPRSVGLLNDTLTAVSVANWILPGDFTWRTTDNQNVPFNQNNLRGLAKVMADRNWQAFKDSWAAKDA